MKNIFFSILFSFVALVANAQKVSTYQEVKPSGVRYTAVDAAGNGKLVTPEEARIFNVRVLKIAGSLTVGNLYPQYKGYEIAENNGNIVTAKIDSTGKVFQIAPDYLTGVMAASTYESKTNAQNNYNYEYLERKRVDDSLAANAATKLNISDFHDNQTLQNVTGKDSVTTHQIQAKRLIVHGDGSINLLSTAIGDSSLLKNATGQANTAIGVSCLVENTTAHQNVGVGTYVLQKNNGSGNTAIGFAAMQNNVNGVRNVSAGYNSMWKNVSGNYNVSFGFSAMAACLTGDGNLSGGYNSLFKLISGSYNVALGFNAGNQITTGTKNTIVGASFSAETMSITTGNQNILIGYGAIVPSATSDNQLSLGNSIYALDLGLPTSKVGIGTSAPKTKFEVATGDIYVSDATKGIILRSPNGGCYRITMSDSGDFVRAPMTCPN